MLKCWCRCCCYNCLSCRCCCCTQSSCSCLDPYCCFVFVVIVVAFAVVVIFDIVLDIDAVVDSSLLCCCCFCQCCCCWQRLCRRCGRATSSRDSTVPSRASTPSTSTIYVSWPFRREATSTDYFVCPSGCIYACPCVLNMYMPHVNPYMTILIF